MSNPRQQQIDRGYRIKGFSILKYPKKYSDIIKTMDYEKVDVLTAGQLMVDDLISVDDEVVSILNITSLPDGYTLEVVNDFGEKDIIEVAEYQQFDLMLLL
jgi:hypothetical protein